MIGNVKYMRLVLPVRYGNEDMPPFMPFRKGDTFDMTYDLKSGKICDFDKQVFDINDIIKWNTDIGRRVDPGKLSLLSIFNLIDMKVTDSGSYYLLDENFEVLYSLLEEYVPNSYSIDGEYGDYINLEIDLKNGTLINLKEKATFKEFLEKEED